MPHQMFRMLRSARLGIAPVAFLLMSASMAFYAETSGQEQELAQIYSDGVHAFFRCDAHTAKQFFDNAITHGSQDPRVHFFRALTHHAMGDTVAFEDDVRMGAELEVRGSGTFDIGRALERIQGPTRIELERIRREVHLTLAKQRPARRAPSADSGMGQPNLVPDFGRQLPATETDPFKDDEEPKMEEVVPDPEKEPALEDSTTEDSAAADTETESPSDETEAESDTMDDFGTDEAAPTEPDAGLEEAAPAEPDADLQGDAATEPESTDNPFETDDGAGLEGGAGDEVPAADAPAGDVPAAEGADPAAGPPTADAPQDGADAPTDDVFSTDNPFDAEGT